MHAHLWLLKDLLEAESASLDNRTYQHTQQDSSAALTEGVEGSISTSCSWDH